MSFPQGCSFRGSLGYTTDGANDFGIFGGTLSPYPTTSTQGNNVGWETFTTPPSGVDSLNTNDPRLVGYNGTQLETPDAFRIDITPGPKLIRLGAGVPSGRGTQTANWDAYDNNTFRSFLCFSNPVGSSFLDAVSNSWNNTFWPSQNIAVSATFISSIFRLKNNINTKIEVISYIYVEDVPVNTTITPRATLRAFD